MYPGARLRAPAGSFYQQIICINFKLEGIDNKCNLVCNSLLISCLVLRTWDESAAPAGEGEKTGIFFQVTRGIWVAIKSYFQINKFFIGKRNYSRVVFFFCCKSDGI